MRASPDQAMIPVALSQIVTVETAATPHVATRKIMTRTGQHCPALASTNPPHPLPAACWSGSHVSIDND